MLQTPMTAPFWFRFRDWICFCARKSTLDEAFVARLDPFVLAGFAFWCDRLHADVDPNIPTPALPGSDLVA